MKKELIDHVVELKEYFVEVFFRNKKGLKVDMTETNELLKKISEKDKEPIKINVELEIT